MERRRPKQAGAGLAARHLADVEYDDTEKGFVPSYPWFKLRTLIAQKLREQGRSLTLTGTSDENEGPPVVE